MFFAITYNQLLVINIMVVFGLPLFTLSVDVHLVNWRHFV
jgi:hypothetical protein